MNINIIVGIKTIKINTYIFSDNNLTKNVKK